MAEETRTCRDCGEEGPVGGYYRKNTICRECEAKRSRERFAALSEKEKESRRQYHRDYHSSHPASRDRRQRLADNQRARASVKRQTKPPKMPVDTSGITSKKCKGCGEVKPLEFFAKHKGGYLGHVARCIPCLNKYRRERFGANPHLVQRRQDQQRSARLQWSPEKRQYRSQVNRQWREERQTEESKERQRAGIKRWERANPLKLTEKSRRRAARKRNATVGKVSYDRILERDGMHCYLCDRDIAEGELSFDHVIPLARDGAHSEKNIRTAHKSCNLRKSDLLLHEIRGSWLRLVS